MAKVIAVVLQVLLKIVSLDIIPKGYLTKIVAGLALIGAVGNLCGLLAAGFEQGSLSSPQALEAVLTATLGALAGLGVGLGRKLDAAAEEKKIAP